MTCLIESPQIRQVKMLPVRGQEGSHLLLVNQQENTHSKLESVQPGVSTKTRHIASPQIQTRTQHHRLSRLRSLVALQAVLGRKQSVERLARRRKRERRSTVGGTGPPPPHRPANARRPNAPPLPRQDLRTRPTVGTEPTLVQGKVQTSVCVCVDTV